MFRYAAFTLVAVCVIIFILQTIFPFITDNFALYSDQVLYRPYQLVTSIFLHGSFEHLFYNMFALALFGSILEKIIGYKKFLIVYFVSGIIAGIGTIPFYTASLGASGAIFGILGTLTILRPSMTVYVGYVPMPMAFAAIIWAAIDMIGMFAPSGTANAAHLFGLFFGIIIGFYLRKSFGEHRTIRKTETLPDKTMRKWEDEYL